ncbi:PIN domain-containing protein [Kibdelosporangium lantanae]|uniref:PIN domain-containing protein n=1 Tax=Kibdelosporangium lantanae TaxID=1497396 RepID=A0ABW3M6V5_9PSEU
MPFSALLDACVLIPIHLADLLLRLGEMDLYRPLWSAEVLDEVERNLPKMGVPPHLARKRVDAMRSCFPEAEVSGYEHLLPIMTNNPKDRHVLAAATHAKAKVITTSNLKDFPADALKPHGVNAVSPNDFLTDTFDRSPDQTIDCLRAQHAKLRNPLVPLDEFCTRLGLNAPTFTSAVRPHLG